MLREPKKTAVFTPGLPRDVILGDMFISFVDRSQANVENYRSILIYTDTLIKLQARNCRVVIHGARLKIDYYMVGGMKITGQISSLELETQIRGRACLTEWLLHNWGGHVRLRLHDYSPERFPNLCNVGGLEVWGLIYNRDGDYEFFMTVEECRWVKPLVRKAQVRLHTTSRYGLLSFIYRYRKRWYYGAGITAFFMVLYVMSLFIWDIQFEGNYGYTYDTLVCSLDIQDIDYGMLKARISCEDLETSTRTSFPEITWVSARVSGTRLLVHIKENEVLSITPEKDETPCDIMTFQSGVITSMVVCRGVIQVCVGDEVEEGQVLVSGRVPTIGDNKEEINAYMVYADADIAARTARQYEKIFPLLYQERVHTGRRRRGWYTKAGAWPFTSLTPVRGQGEWDYSMEEKQFRLLSNFYLPVYMGAIQGREMAAYERNYREDKLKELSKTINYQFVKNLEKKGV